MWCAALSRGWALGWVHWRALHVHVAVEVGCIKTSGGLASCINGVRCLVPPCNCC